MLFLTAGAGKSRAFPLVIQAAPSVRRELIEEAAGVRRLRDQRQEALNRLAEAERDMGRARDILSELTPRVEELRGQADTMTIVGLEGC